MPPSDPPTVFPAPSPRRIGAMVLRYWYLLRGSWPRILELAYWPTMQMILWGYINQFMAANSAWVAQGAGVLIAAVLLWDVLFRGQLGVSVSFLEEMWSRNLGHLFVSPLRPGEWLTALMTMSLIRTLIGIVPAALLAIPFFGYSVFDLGLPLALFFANLIAMGWWLGLLVIALILRYGMGAEGLAWIVVFLLAPVSAVYYPVTVLPEWLQWVAFLLPSSHVFEGMRGVLFDGAVRWGELAWAVALNGLYMAAGVATFLFAFRQARVRGALLQTGE
ncbi:ABC transporter permease [Azospirillum sp. RWY-5-1]|uniref:Transport permease protein n=1 Tax=Azospirillum oleiclasticum TaxID=2735135 RepID=A0ABX2T9W2_9PROT|nr:ABC transporter permease [Azospirillum oleiclasticum]NYZ13444.1 ABC transporter permease [Azospirillum oleiclasticum]NYZ20605.1 ABC transporter permease [Azospirillum oleiclasticum]